MHIDHHPLIAEFPEHRDAIHRLKSSDAHFARLMSEYEEMDKSVVRAENGVEHLGDLALEELKKKRLHLKDELSKILSKG